MHINKYVEFLIKTYNARVIDFKKEARNYFSNPDMYGADFDIDCVSEGNIQSNMFCTLIIDGSKIDPKGFFKNGTKANIVFVEYDKEQTVINYFVLSSFFCSDRNAWISFLRVLEDHKRE